MGGRGLCSLVDAEGRFLGLLGGKPRAEAGRNSWTDVVSGIPALIESAKRGVRFPKKMCLHRRGRFPAPAAGVGYGGGEKHPVNRAMTKSVRRFMEQILHSPLTKRLSGWVNCLFQAHNPAMYHAYADNLDAILRRDSSLRRNFSNSVFALLTVNAGRRTVTKPHRDRANRPPGWCPVSAFGLYDPTRGGQMVLEEFKLIIDFPPGTTIYIPSAIVTHCNTDISPGEMRYSLTQYTPGALFRWVYNGFQTQEAFFHSEKTSLEDKARFWRDQSTRWVDSLKYFPKLS
ncbi:hypothetical protein BDZ89DRAFT_974000 [Hymenopellis radicata]|nr:hypothetical protein BDZ89DRAFT_974000 [Hymenopellis radicata]